jgi:hypothetical protein
LLATAFVFLSTSARAACVGGAFRVSGQQADFGQTALKQQHAGGAEREHQEDSGA